MMPFEPLPLHISKDDVKFKPLPLRVPKKDSGFTPLPLITPAPSEPIQEKASFMAEHPNLYGMYGAAKETVKTAVPYLKYFDPADDFAEWEKFKKLDQQHQTRDLLFQSLFSVLYPLPATRGFKYGTKKLGSLFAKEFPKIHKLLTKPIGKTKVTGKQIFKQEIEKPTPEVQKVTTALKGSTPIKLHPKPKMKPELEGVYKEVFDSLPSHIQKDVRIATVRVVKFPEEYAGTGGRVHLAGSVRDPKQNYHVFIEKGEPLKETLRHEILHTYVLEHPELTMGKGYFGHEKAVDILEQSLVLEKSAQTVQKVVKVLKEAKPLRKEQELIYTQERGERIAELIKIGEKTTGEKGYYAQLSALKGKMPKVQFESIRNKIGQKDIDALFNQIKGSSLSEWDKLPAGKGLAKLFGEYGGTVPTENELRMLKSVFGSDFVKTALSKRIMFAKFKYAGLQIANIPRSIMASFDLSAPLRQGVFLIGKPKQWFSAFKSMFKPFVSESTYQQFNKSLSLRPTYKLMKENKLALTELGTRLTTREEAFMSNWAEKIPLVGRGVRASGRAYTTFLNKLRADVFDDFVKKGTELGIKDPKYLKSAASFVNSATGRGGLGKLENSAVILNTWFFSPRLLASRLHLLNPVYYGKLHPAVRKEALKSLLTFGSVALGTAGLAKYGGADIGLDPRNADFMKPKFGNKRYDILGGFQQPIRLAAQLISGKIISSTTGKTMVLGEGYRGLTRTEIISRFLEYKQAPLVSFATGLIRGKTSLGEKFDIPTEVVNRFIPMVVRDMQELYEEEGTAGIPMAIPAIFGVGVQAYGGVASYGLSGKDHPKLNAELFRLKTSMGYPSSSAFGQELTNKEYKNLKLKTGQEIAKNLTKLISSSKYKEVDDRFKIKMIERKVDISKQRMKTVMFPGKHRKSIYKSELKTGRGLSDEDADRLAEEYMRKNPTRGKQ